MSIPSKASATSKASKATNSAGSTEATNAESAGQLAPNVSVIEGGTQAGIEAEGREKPQPPLAELFKQLNSSPQGLTTREARQRLARFGTNEPAPAHHTALVVQVLLFFANPL